MIIAIDFDGTCVTHEYPDVGKDIGAVTVLKKLVDNGHQLILYTMRSYKIGVSPVTGNVENGGLQDAIDWFDKNNIPLFGINTNPQQLLWTESPKAYADLYIDDAALGCPLLYTDKRPHVNWERVEIYLESLGIIKKVFQ